MNASALIVFFLVALLAAVSAVPVSYREEQPLELLPSEKPTEEENLGLRFRRVTCDVLSLSAGSVSLNHSVCALHCLALLRGFKGGNCDKGVCKCRK